MDINEGADWATSLAIEDGADHYLWDGDGVGAGLRRQTTEAFSGKKITATMFKGSEPTPQVLSNAQRSYDALMTDTLVVPSMRRRGDFPVGQGNKYDVFTSDRYYPGDLPLIDGDIPNA